MAKVSAEKPKKRAKQHVRRIVVEKTGNGATVHHEMESPAGERGSMMMMRQEPAPPMGFEKMSRAHKHVKGLMAQMHGDPEEMNEGPETPEQEAAE